ncbi:hypothetical protein AQ765_30535 [Burkholderia pseudomallei]|nr:hypothetical protein D512_04550 [Burkholderia pseudomallei MSHR1043]KGS70545.1 hypothetical protein X990_2438 [Burkholderia pseudomallei MSHR4868]OMR11871.1 hypothetical protein AQ718_21210 [Burkholderia pseudomallei]OMR80501.1 hypothetical protein AQ731_03125 [Burkholderia pseudomallei]OMR89749.1 hypothetical protein AQ732_05630 [Burkholderia pseudomallei]
MAEKAMEKAAAQRQWAALERAAARVLAAAREQPASGIVTAASAVGTASRSSIRSSRHSASSAAGIASLAPRLNRGRCTSVVPGSRFQARAIAADRDDRLADVRHRNEPRRVSLRDSTTAFDTGSVRASVCVAAHPVDDER